MAVWVVRDDENRDFERLALQGGTIAVKFDEIPVDLLVGLSAEEMKKRVQEQATIVPYQSIDQFCYFRDDIRVDELLVMPHTIVNGNWQEIAVGEIKGRYEDNGELNGYRHRRAVNWINKAVPRADVNQELQDAMDPMNDGRWVVYIGARGRETATSGEAERQFRAIAETRRTTDLGHWGGDTARWDAFIGWAKRFFEWERFDEYERDYKLEEGRNLAAVKEDFLSKAPNWEDRLQETLRGYNANNLLGWRTSDNFLSSGQSRLDEMLSRIWGVAPDDSLENRVRNFDELAPIRAAGARTALISYLLMADDATQHPMYRWTPLRDAYRLTGYPSDANDSRNAWERYSCALNFLDKFIEESAARGLEVWDRLHAQGLVWCVTQYEPLEDWPQEVQEKFQVFQRGELVAPPPSVDPEPSPPPQDPWSQPNITALAGNLLWEPKYLQEIIQDLQEKRQVIFYGPPGTGKTYVAREIAKQCRLNGGDFEIVQFHPSYSYEDFVEGFRPKLIGTQAGFELVQGPLRRIADRARNNPAATYILVIDELNRGNIAKVFGELYFLLEYRDEEVRLQYGGDGRGFSLPKNLWFICTMNTADRSIALMDAALRRRFYFAPFFPNEPPIQGLLDRWLEREGRDTLAAALIDEANKNLDRHAGIGPSYFMRPGQDLDEPTVRRIWGRAVIPYIEEQCFGDEEKLAGFDFDRLKGQVSSGGSPNDTPVDGNDQSEGGDADPNAG